MRRSLIAVAVSTLVVLLLCCGAAYYFINNYKPVSNSDFPDVNNESETENSFEPNLEFETIVENLKNPWDIDFVNESLMIFTQRDGQISSFDRTTGEQKLIEKFTETFSVGEGGLMGLTLDREFENNSFAYLCTLTGNVISPEVKVFRIRFNEDLTKITDKKEIVTGIRAIQVGRHSGCRVEMSSDNVLWVSTGDASIGEQPQDPKSLGGKILRIDREGKAVDGNLGGEFDPRIYSYGHRNSQGLALFDEPIDGSWGYSSEHGSRRDDEVNALVKGNFGWDPVPGYNETVEMTDLEKFPDAHEALWSSGEKTIAISGMTLVRGKEWGNWENAILLAVQKDQHIRLMKFSDSGEILRDEKVIDGYGRIRAVQQSPDGSIYFLTDNGGGDKIVRITLK